MIQRIEKYIRCNSLLEKEGLHLIALSGGADSVCLLLSLLQLGYKVEAVHCNFHLRGEESDRDEAFCRQLCEDYSVPFHIVHFDTKTYAELHKVSIEMAARELRYRYFEQLRNDIEAVDICVAHHKDDNVETVLMNIIRGTGLTGLIGIRPQNGSIKRPLLCVSREEIVHYLKARNQSYVTDSTNLVNDVTRNKLRLDIIPLLKDINSAAQDNILNMVKWLTDVEKITTSAISKEIDGITSKTAGTLSVSIEGLATCVSPEYTLFTILHPYGFTSSQIEEISNTASLQTGKIWQSESHVLVVDRGSLLIQERSEIKHISFRIPEEGNYVITEDVILKIQTIDVDPDFVIEKSPDVATLDASKVRFPLTVRRIQQGDRFVPFGMKGSKLVSDYLTDRKCSYFEKQQQLVLTDADGNIVWLIGERPDARYCVTQDTIKSLIVRFKNN